MGVMWSCIGMLTNRMDGEEVAGLEPFEEADEELDEPLTEEEVDEEEEEEEPEPEDEDERRTEFDSQHVLHTTNKENTANQTTQQQGDS